MKSSGTLIINYRLQTNISMSLFQTQVERQFLAGLTTDLTPIYKKYFDYFGNPAIRANILELNEQQYQGEFIEALFVNILGYTAQPQPNFNLLREKKNEIDAKSADAAISINNQIVAVIELKDHKTQDLKKIEVQAFGYKNNHKNCHYVVTSNFERLRFYIDNAVDFIEFDLFNLTFDEFRRLWLCLSYESIAKNLPQEIKNQSISNEDVITKQLYKDYSVFKRQLFDSIVSLNPDFDKLLLFKKTQKLLDRFLFLLFAEDKELLPANSVKGTVDKWKKFNDDPMNDYQSLYSRFVKYFKLLDVGYKDASTEIYAYNGGLFANDDLLNQIKVEDAVLSDNVLKLAAYDYDTDVDVNILGHIFENSLNEIDEIKEMLDSKTSSSLGRSGGVSKRKQDGVFYTPRYITQYIVENTVGRLCEDKKTELGIGEELFEYKTPAKRKKAVNAFDDYREWLLHISFVDPACGSGAFLNRTLDFLIAEHNWIDRQQEKIAGLKGHYSMELSNIENTILENNLFGVDINDESVEIAKLSLWLRTAKPHRKLNSLNNNIKCGNSLIDDPAVAGEKAFDWHKEFPQVFTLKEKKIWHVTWVTHDTRTSARMIKYKVREMKQNGEGHIDRPYYFDEKEAIEITRIIAGIIAEDEFNCLEYNICSDHVHIILVCDEEELPNVVRKLKGKSAQKFKEYLGLDKEETFHLWAQKFDRNCITLNAELQTLINNIHTNSSRHQLPDTNKGLQPHANSTSLANSMLLADSLPDADSNKGLLANSIPDADTNKGLQPLVNSTLTDLNSLAYSNSELQNKINYIRTNRKKHGLPDINKELPPLVEKMRCTTQYAFRPEYKGGFDVVIGNPPYVQLQSMGDMSEILKNCGYETFDKGADLYCLFTERGYKLLKKGGFQSYIMPNKWMLVAYGKPLRKFLSNTGLHQILNFGDIQFFQEATTYVCVFVTQKSNKSEKVKVLSLNQKNYHGDFITEVQNNIYEYPSENFSDTEWSIQPYIDAVKLDKMKQNGIELKELPVSIYRGILTGYNEAFYIDEETRQKLIAADPKSEEIIKPMVRGRDIISYGYTDYEYLLNVHNGIKDKNNFTLPIDITNYPEIKKHLDNFYPMLLKRGDKGDTPYNLRNCAYLDEFAKPKIIYPNMTSVFPFMYDESGILGNQKCFILTAQDDSVSLLYLTAVFNSSLAKLWIWYNCPELQGGTREISKVYFEHFPVPQANDEQTEKFEQSTKNRIAYNKELQLLVGKFQRMFQRKFELEELPGKLQNWYMLSYREFIAELGKKKVKLTLAQEAEWEEYFHAEQAKALEIKKQIDDTDKEIDRMVYALYELTEEEVKIVEGV